MVRKGGVHEVTKRDPARSTVAQPTLPAIALSMALASSFAVCGLDTVYHGPALTKLTVRSFGSVRRQPFPEGGKPPSDAPVLETRVIPHCARVPVGLSFPAAHHAQLPCDYTQRAAGAGECRGAGLARSARRFRTTGSSTPAGPYSRREAGNASGEGRRPQSPALSKRAG